MHHRSQQSTKGFTIVEIIVVITVIGLLAGLTFVGYGAWRSSALSAKVKNDLQSAAAAMETERAFGDGYPESVPSSFTPSEGVTLTGGSADGATYCIAGSSAEDPSVVFHITEQTKTAEPTEGGCPVMAASGDYIQTITSSNCPDTRIMAVDARDNHTYWVQKLADGKCWMLTNLAYGGGGINTYGDAKVLVNGTDDTDGSYTEPRYYIHSGANPTVNPTSPSVSTSGTGQYGYLYNWCGAMGGQETAACLSSATPAPDVTTSVCPAGWRLPVGGPGGDFEILNNSINGGQVNTDVGLRQVWLTQYGGTWGSSIGFSGQGGYARHWSSSVHSAPSAYNLGSTNNSFVDPSNYSNKHFAVSVRCLAN